MSYQVIARKWRPQAFEEVTGQEPITRTLRNAIEHDRLHHAYLFSGARGVGKTTTARLLAKALNCHKSDKPIATPCAFTDSAACASCREIAEGRSIDVLEIDAASNTGVDNVRESIINTVAVRPARDRYKVFIIDEVHMLSGAAFNALLKTLEEPPPRVLFIMATTEAHKVPDTILSRCQQFEFRTIPAAKIADRLRLIAEAERIDITPDALAEIARAGEGSMRDAQSAFDQVISFSGASITTEDVEVALGLAGTELLRRTMRAVAEGRRAELVAVVEDLVMRGHDLRNFARDLLAYTRDLLVARITNDNNGSRSRDDSETVVDAETAELSARFSESDLVRFFRSLSATERDLRDGVHPRYELEIGLVKLVDVGRLADIDDVLRRLTELEASLRGGGNITRAPGGGSAPPVGGSGLPPRPAGTRGGNLGAPRASFAASSPPAASPLSAASSSVAQTSAALSASPSSVATAVAATSQAVPLARDFAPVPPTNAPLKLVSQPAQATQPPPAIQAPRQRVADFDGLIGADSSDDSTPIEEFDLRGDGGSASSIVADADVSLVERIKVELEKRHRAFVVVALEEASRVTLDEGDLCVDFAPRAKHLRDNLTRPDNIKALREVCRDVTGRDIGLRIAVRDPSDIKDVGIAAAAPPDEREQQRLKAEEERAELWRYAESHPKVQAFMRVFRGEIVDVWREPTDPAQTNATPERKS